MKNKINIQIISTCFLNDIRFHLVQGVCTLLCSHKHLYIKCSVKLNSYIRIRAHEVGSCLTLNSGLIRRRNKETHTEIINS